MTESNMSEVIGLCFLCGAVLLVGDETRESDLFGPACAVCPEEAP